MLSVRTRGLRPTAPAGRPIDGLLDAFPGIRRADSAETDRARDHDRAIDGVAISTLDLEPGDLFVAVAGANRHGAELVPDAARLGAVAVLSDESGARLALGHGLPVLVAPDPRALLGGVAAWVFGTDRVRPALFGVTGTNGKTSTVHMIEAILRQLGLRTGLSSTAERHVAGLEVVSGLTTPEAPEFHALLARMNEESVAAAAIEVSAQALSRRRLDGIGFDVAGFTNLSHDHLDDYGTLERYLDAKRPLFASGRAGRAVVSLDSAAGASIAEGAGVPVETIASSHAADWRVEPLAFEARRTRFRLLRHGEAVLETWVPVLGAHMAANAGLAIAMLDAGGWPVEAVREVLDRDGGIAVRLPGRIERVSDDSSPAVYVDFGHSEDAFARSLEAVRRVTTGRVVMVFGADGDRDPVKRPAMARAAAAGSDLVVVTDHHPRFEDPASIRRTLVDAVNTTRPGFPVIEVADPKRAIRAAVAMVGPGDAILWAGPGHQNYRDIEGVHVPYSARDEARAALREHGWRASEPLRRASAR